MKLDVVIERGKDGYFIVHCPALPGCWSQGKTEEEALRNIKDAAKGCLVALNKKARKGRKGIIREVAV